MTMIPLATITNWHEPSIWIPQVLLPINLGGNLDFSGIVTLRRADVEGVIAMLHSFSWSEEELYVRLGVHTMTPEVRRAVLPIFNLKPPVELNTTLRVTNNPFAQLARVQRTYREYVETFARPNNQRIQTWLESEVKRGSLLWREPHLQLRRQYASGQPLDALIGEGLRHLGRRFEVLSAHTSEPLLRAGGWAERSFRLMTPARAKRVGQDGVMLVGSSWFWFTILAMNLRYAVRQRWRMGGFCRVTRAPLYHFFITPLLRPAGGWRSTYRVIHSFCGFFLESSRGCAQRTPKCECVLREGIDKGLIP